VSGVTATIAVANRQAFVNGLLAALPDSTAGEIHILRIFQPILSTSTRRLADESQVKVEFAVKPTTGSAIDRALDRAEAQISVLRFGGRAQTRFYEALRAALTVAGVADSALPQSNKLASVAEPNQVDMSAVLRSMGSSASTGTNLALPSPSPSPASGTSSHSHSTGLPVAGSPAPANVKDEAADGSGTVVIAVTVICAAVIMTLGLCAIAAALWKRQQTILPAVQAAPVQCWTAYGLPPQKKKAAKWELDSSEGFEKGTTDELRPLSPGATPEKKKAAKFELHDPVP